VSLLRERGYVNVRHYPGGLTEWSDHAPPEASSTTIEDPAPAGAPVSSGARRSRVPNVAVRFVTALADRPVGALLRLWLEIVLLFGVAYWAVGWFDETALTTGARGIGTGVDGFFTALYFSAVTATSVGYGDIVPTGLTRLLAIAEGVAGLILFGCVVSKFVSRRQDALIAEIHHIAFEERLGRVRTNLLLVRAELQATARLCEGHEMAPPEALARVESAAMVFVGELHSVHDLLYRAHDTPEETVLEAILAGLASVFREFLDLLICVRGQRGERSPLLAASIEAMSRLARDICGDCVPKQFAPSLRNWMDEIQRLAGRVEQI
jgi:ion channel